MIRTTKKKFPAYFTFLFCAVVFLVGACKREPEWSPEIKNFLESTNRDLEEIAPHFARSSSPEIVLVGLIRMDKAMDRIVLELRAFFQKYPFLLKDPKPIGMRYGSQVQRLQKNVQKIIMEGAYWHEKLKKQKKVEDLVQSILKKIREADKVTRLPESN